MSENALAPISPVIELVNIIMFTTAGLSFRTISYIAPINLSMSSTEFFVWSKKFYLRRNVSSYNMAASLLSFSVFISWPKG